MIAEAEKTFESLDSNTSQDMLLVGIADWKFFEERLTGEADHWYPSTNLRQKLGISEWKNIPPPVTKMTEVFTHCFFNTTNIFTHLIKESKIKSEFIVSKFKKVDKNMADSSEKFKRLLEINRKNLLKDISKMQNVNENQAKHNEFELRRIQEEIQRDREIMNAELMKYDTSVETKRVIDKEISILRTKLR